MTPLPSRSSTPQGWLIVGPGKLGQTFGLLAKAQGDCIVGIIGRTASHATAACEWLQVPSRYAFTLDTLSADCVATTDWLLLATPDDAISATAQALARRLEVLRQHPRPGAVALHASGLLPANHLVPLDAVGFALGTCHPLKAMPSPRDAAATFADTPCAIEGSPVAITALTELTQRWQARPFTLLAQHKPLYHAAAVFASNYVLALADQAFTLLLKCEIERALAADMIYRLISGTAQTFVTHGTPHALTGPIERGDLAAVCTHLEHLKTEFPHAAELYRHLGLVTVAVAERKHAELGTENRSSAISAIQGFLNKGK